jgi:hypothetical protein
MDARESFGSALSLKLTDSDVLKQWPCSSQAEKGRDPLSPTTRQIPDDSAPNDRRERLELARQLFERFHTLCFWHSPRDLEITDDLIPFVARGLRANGGRVGWTLAGKLRSNASDRESLGCR